MTAIVGFTYLDGVLMMADTEETTSSATKSDTEKLFRCTFPIGTIITGGAGDSHMIEYANQELHRFFIHGGGQTPDRKSTPDELLQALNEFAHKFFGDNFSQYSGFASELVPSFEMLIALNYDKRSYLFHWVDNRVVWIRQHAAIGTGMIQLHPMLRDFQFAATKESTLFMGLRMMFHAKRIVQAVGGKTEAVALQNDGASHFFGLDTTQKVESLVTNLEQFLNKFVYTLVSNISTDVAEIEQNVAANLNEIPDLLNQYRNQYRKIMSDPQPPPVDDEKSP